jgi:hypothetical protein
MKWCIGKLEGQTGMIVFFADSTKVLGVKAKSLRSLFRERLVASAVSDIFKRSEALLGYLNDLGLVDFNLADKAESLAGGGLAGFAAGQIVGKAQDAAVAKAEEVLTNFINRLIDELYGTSDEIKTDEQSLMGYLEQGDLAFSVPLANLKSASGKQQGLLQKTYQITLKEKGFWIFGTTHKLVFNARNIEPAKTFVESLPKT